ncbi:single-stranded DNA-binding protein [Curtobacterium caseinilyticum]|uniref:Single-stranded DNA-binding protein n=1 Tax=Curtobacterium caseinilyticum TaxID=3055137 RepID=A0ABT7TRY5_9MICO|nr:single-stranded DNA-binding protein [Curtobacterium caseinilyticum]MDM7892377.1 single-stranded DNA-binding protein [Curtobacterium caseinilyticum]
MNDTITVCGIVATEPRHLVTDTGIAISSLRLASPSRRWDRGTSAWTNGTTNWYTVTAFRSLAANVHKSLKKGDRVVVTGRVRIRTWERDGRGGTSVEIDAEGIGHDLAWGISNWIRVPRHSSESTAVPGDAPSVDPQTGEVHSTAGPGQGTGRPDHGPGGPDHGAGRATPGATGPVQDPESIEAVTGTVVADGVGVDGEDLPDPAEAARQTAAVLGGDFGPASEQDDPERAVA